MLKLLALRSTGLLSFTEDNQKISLSTLVFLQNIINSVKADTQLSFKVRTHKQIGQLVYPSTLTLALSYSLCHSLLA